MHFQIDIPLKPVAGLTRPNAVFWQFAKTAIFEVQNKRLLGQDPPRVCIDAVFRWQILCQQNVPNPREYWIADATISSPGDRCMDQPPSLTEFRGDEPVKSGVHFQIDIPLKPAAGLTRPNTDFWEFAKTAVFEAQNKRFLGKIRPGCELMRFGDGRFYVNKMSQTRVNAELWMQRSR